MSMKDLRIIKDNYIPSPPDGENWRDKKRDHDSFQKIVSEEEIQGGMNSSTGCPTPSAEKARSDAKLRYLNRQIIQSEEIIQKK